MRRNRTPERLSRRARNRALLARQHLLERTKGPVDAVLEHLVGLQAQTPQSPYVGVWSRLEAFDPQALSALLEKRDAVRMSLQRGTIHLVTSDDALRLWLLFESMHARVFRGSVFGKRLKGADVEAVAKAGRPLVENRAMSLGALSEELAALFPKADEEALGYVVRYFVPIVQPPPRGLWRGSGKAEWIALETWLGRPLKKSSLEALVQRYLAAFGPATPADAQTWSGLKGLDEVFEALRPTLRVFRDEDGRERFDVPDAPRPDEDTPAPPRFLPDYDNVLLSHDDRSHVVDEAHKPLYTAANGGLPTVLIDGRVGATWKLERQGKKKAELVVRPFEKLSKRVQAEVGAEAERLLGFLAADSAGRDVQFEDP